MKNKYLLLLFLAYHQIIIMKFPIIFLLIMLPFAARSQVEVGVRSGVAFSKQKYDDYGYAPHLSNHIEGIDVGATLNWFFLRSFFLQPELTLIQKGGAYSNSTIKVNHLEIAALFGYERKNEKLSLFLNYGVFVDKILNIVKDRTGGNPKEIEDNIWGWGFAHGGGAAIPIGKGWIGLAGRYRYSLSGFRLFYLTDIHGELIPDRDPIITYKNRGWSINLYYKIDIQ